MLKLCDSAIFDLLDLSTLDEKFEVAHLVLFSQAEHPKEQPLLIKAGTAFPRTEAFRTDINRVREDLCIERTKILFSIFCL